MPEKFLLIPGRTSKQGTSLNEGKYTQGYLEETSTLQVSPEDMERLSLQEGDEVRIWNVARTQEQLIGSMNDSLDQNYYNNRHNKTFPGCHLCLDPM